MDMEFNAPLHSKPNSHLELKRGHRVVTIDDDVYIKNEDAGKAENAHPEDNYSLALFGTSFVEANPKIFKKI